MSLSVVAVLAVVVEAPARAAPVTGEAPCEAGGAKPKSSSLEFVAKLARPDLPQEVQVQSPGPLYVTLDRTLATFKGQVRLEIDRKTNEAGEFQDRCSTGWIDTTKPVQVRNPAGVGEVSIWRLKVFDSAGGGPTGESPYVINVIMQAPVLPGGQRLTALTPLPSNKPFSGEGSEPSRACGASTTSIREGSTLEPARTTSNENIRSDTPWLWFATAGRYLYVKLKADHPVKARVRMYAKEPSGQAFRGVCESIVELSTTVAREYITGQADWDRVMHPLWRIEIEPLGEAGKQAFSSISATAFREVGSEPLPGPGSTGSTTFAWKIASDCYQCRAWTPGAASSPSQQKSSPAIAFAIATGLAIDLPTNLSREDSAFLLRTLRTAIGIWLANCRDCNYDAMSVIRIGSQYWLRSDVANPILLLGQTNGFFPDHMRGNRTLARVATAVGGVELFGEGPITEEKRLSVCASDSGRETPDLLRIKGALKCMNTTTPDSGHLTEITLLMPTDRPTACGRGTNIIACEEEATLVELNGRDYRFCLGTDTFRCVGSGPRAVDLMQIMLHEVGHWIGLGHSNSASSIMASTMQTSRCITNDDVGDLQALVAHAPQTEAKPEKHRAFRLSDMDD
ncbi:matrixin family metalloprotease [Bradyrhizobium sp. 44]|uniref:matrixin family metalloprotease n=1 Tax=Bradyrhizobium sp. 44 TaxID=2782675 RepID=UPI001FF9C99A|nr:matrixin family metalloprotease [Bradyrhizobium sp. 44]MCK1285418.1 matrixin family metalloprotease [Bradyrhizobium sp. 44]